MRKLFVTLAAAAALAVPAAAAGGTFAPAYNDDPGPGGCYGSGDPACIVYSCGTDRCGAWYCEKQGHWDYTYDDYGNVTGSYWVVGYVCRPL